MAKLHELQERRSVAVSEMQEINQKAESENRDYSAAEDKRHKELKTELAGLDKQIQRAADLQEATRSAPAILHHGRGDGNFEDRCRSFSLRKAILAQIPGADVDAGSEKELSRELERRSGRPAQGVLCPTSVFEKRADVITTGLPAAGPGGTLVATELLAGQFIDILRTSLATRRLGATVLNNLVGNVDVPRLKASATALWVQENAAITASDVQFDKVQLVPHHVGAIVEYSRNMVQQASPDVENILRNDFAALLARALDAAAINGTAASDEPTGILQTTGVIDVPTGAAGGAPTWANILLTIAGVAGENALQGSLGFLTNSKVTAKCSTVLKSSADTSSSFILDGPGDTTLAGYPLVMSNLVPSTLEKGASGAVCSALIFGNWSDLLIGYWSSFDVLVNPFSEVAYTKGNILIRGMLTADIAVRQPKSFAKIADLTTT